MGEQSERDDRDERDKAKGKGEGWVVVCLEWRMGWDSGITKEY